MSSSTGHTIQKLIHSTPVSASVNNQTTTVVTTGGDVFQAGLINNKIQPSFQEVFTNANIVGHVIETASSENDVYLLTANGYVFAYDYNNNHNHNSNKCPLVREIYSPAVCHGDKAVHIDAGRDHVVILTHHHKVFGAGDNHEYQLVPQGQCRYDNAVELHITDTNLHDDRSCCKFTGHYTEMKHPVLPKNECGKVSCIKGEEVCKKIGKICIDNVTLNGDSTGAISIDVYADYAYVGFLCVDDCDKAMGTLTLTLCRLFIKCGCQKAHFGCERVDVTITEEIDIFPYLVDQQSRVITTQLCGYCGSTFYLTNLGEFQPFVVTFANGALTLGLNQTSTNVIPFGNNVFTGLETTSFSVSNFQIPICLDCCKCDDDHKHHHKDKCHESCLPQPCWLNVYAGSDITVLADDCNRLYVLGSIHKVRNNRDLFKKSCLEGLLSRANASIILPADELNCCIERNNDNCPCPTKKCHKPFKTDLSRFGIKLNFDGCDKDCCDSDDDCDAPANVCDFLKALKNCNDVPNCENTCTPCDSYIYLNVCDPCPCPQKPVIKNIRLLNRKSICKAVSQNPKQCCALQFEERIVDVNCNSVIEFDMNRYCIDGEDFCLDKIILLRFCRDCGETINLYVDIDHTGGIRFLEDCEKCNVEFTVDADTKNDKFLLNFGDVVDPVELTNLKFFLVQDAIFPCPEYKNPFNSKIINTYVHGGDKICFVRTKTDCNHDMIKLAITPDVPTVFRLNRRILDVGVGHNNISVLVGGLACPNEIYALGENCHGELGLGGSTGVTNTYTSTVCFKQVNRCLFDCQVIGIESAKHVTTYITQSGKVYAAGYWKCLVNTDVPRQLTSVCPTWKIRQVAISETQLVLVGSDGGVYGLGDNNLGQLGLCHIECVPRPVPLSFFHRLSQHIASECAGLFDHPVKRNYYNKEKYHNDGCECDPCQKRPALCHEEYQHKPHHEYKQYEPKQLAYVKHEQKCGDKQCPEKVCCAKVGPARAVKCVNPRNYGVKYVPNARVYTRKY